MNLDQRSPSEILQDELEPINNLPQYNKNDNLEIAYIIGNGPSRKGLDLDTLDGTTFGCNALFRDYAPDYLVSGDSRILKEICGDEYPKEHKCIFPDYDCIPIGYQDILVNEFDPRFNIKESNPNNKEYVWIFGLQDDISDIMEVHVIGVDPDWKITNMQGTEEDPRFSVNFFAGSQAMLVLMPMKERKKLLA